ncbi:hypothetical protein HYPSUDRAFT_208410 [Hypholoma sublateritium FD-334 SS-4]|uniref:Uncharacterized protein n=1 Tax=Hypholoma sublateritium (strain FD-334 SS-4) TaxID=945553 RepID=A0A0D2KJH5_HYPSF|nr:hypothetical protein HYPSUDRAFT_208410 [Hypholoma sublateritium FD-334 SS-4]
MTIGQQASEKQALSLSNDTCGRNMVSNSSITDREWRLLCTTCSSVPIRDYFQPNYADLTPATRVPHEGKEPTPHSLLTEILARRTQCSLCRLIGHAIHAAAKQYRRLPCPAPEDSDTLRIEDLFDEPDTTKLRCYIHAEPIELLEAEIALIPNQAFRLVITMRVDGGSGGVLSRPDYTKMREMIFAQTTYATRIHTPRSPSPTIARHDRAAGRMRPQRLRSYPPSPSHHDLTPAKNTARISATRVLFRPAVPFLPPAYLYSAVK